MSYVSRATLMNAVAVATTGNAESLPFPLQFVRAITGLSVKASSVAGAADVKLEYAVSPDGTNYETYADNTAIVASSATANANATEGFNSYAMPATLPGAAYVKFKVTGVGSNNADALVTMYLFYTEGVLS